MTAAALLVVACASSDHAGHGNGPTQGSPQPADAYVWISGQRLHFWDFGHADNALVLDGSGLTVTITDRGALGMAAGNGCANTAPHEVQCSAAGITLFILEMGSGSDTAENRVPVDGQMYGGEGDDTLLGGPGDQQLNGGAGHDILSGGSGDDLLEGGVGGDVLNGGSGSDTASYGERTSAVIAHIGGTDEGETLEHDTIGHDVENVVGGSGDDALYGNNDANVLRGMAGVDELYGGGGIDSVDGGDDADLVDGGNDGIVDIVIGGDGIDSCAWPQDSISQCEAPAKLPFRR